MIMEAAETADNHCCENFNQNSQGFIKVLHLQHITNQPLMFASNLRNEFAIVIFGYSGITKNFLLNKSGRSIPTRYREVENILFQSVSIVSIQADQSRRSYVYGLDKEAIEFQSYQFRQINPDFRVQKQCRSYSF